MLSSFFFSFLICVVCCPVCDCSCVVCFSCVVLHFVGGTLLFVVHCAIMDWSCLFVCCDAICVVVCLRVF